MHCFLLLRMVFLAKQAHSRNLVGAAKQKQAPTAMPARTLLERVSGRITVSKARRARADAEKEVGRI